MEEKDSWKKAIRGDLLERWPKDEAGAPEEPAWLCTCGNLDLYDELRVNMLEAYGIPCLRIYPGDGSFGKIILGVSGQGVDIYVPASLHDDALALCQSQSGEIEE